MSIFDGNGNPTTYKNAAFTFDPEDRLTSISSPAFSAAYDGDGLRAKKTAAGVTTYYVYDGGTPVAEESFNGTSATFTALNGITADGWRARKQGSLIYDFVYDPQGSVQQRQTDTAFSSGLSAYDRSTFEGYGALRQANKGSTGAGVGQHDPAGFGGQFGYYTDTETGLLCLTHRYYDPGTGKFINRDPIGYAGGANLYGFCDGNPVNESDPNGTNAFTDAWNKWWHHFFLGNGGVKGPRLGDVNPSYASLEDVDGMNDVPGRNLPQNSKKVLQRVNDTYETVVVGVVTAPMGGDGEAVEAVAPVIGKKLLYMLGKATGRAHNIQRSLAMARQLSAICLHDSPQTRKYLTDHLINAFANPSNIARVEANGTIVRDSLLVGPGGVLKVESYWAGNQLKTFKLFGKR